LWDGGEVRSTAETGISGGGKDLSSRLMRTLRRPWKLGNLTWGALGQERIHSGMCQTPRAVSVSEVRARLHDAARFRARSTSHGEHWVKSVFIRACVKLRGLFRYPRSEPDCMTRPVSEHDQPHIRSPLETAVPTSRLRRAEGPGAQKIYQTAYRA